VLSRRLAAQGYYCGFPLGRASPPDLCTKPFNPWHEPAPAKGSEPVRPKPLYGCHLHHTLRLANIRHLGVKEGWVPFSQWHDAPEEEEEEESER